MIKLVKQETFKITQPLKSQKLKNLGIDRAPQIIDKS